MDQVRISQQSNPNVIVFGETGAGKSSVINMVLGSDRANVGNRLLGETFKSTVYPVKLDGMTYNLYDTVGLGEHSGGTVDSAQAVRNLYRLVTDLSNSGGVNLLVFVMKRGRLTETIHKNYELFHHGFCNSKVPIVVVVTGCEDIEPTMDRWWIDNEASFTKAGMPFDGHACVCAFKGRKTNTGGYRNEELVNESVGVVKHLIVQSCMSNGWEKVRNSQSSMTKLEAL
jgi:predicted GTPase